MKTVVEIETKFDGVVVAAMVHVMPHHLNMIGTAHGLVQVLDRMCVVDTTVIVRRVEDDD